MSQEPPSPNDVHVTGNVTGSAIAGGQVQARNIAARDIHEHIYAARELIFPVLNLPPANPHFTGRAALLTQLAAAAPGTATTITQTIAGLGGIGKSQLMLHFAHQQRHTYDIIWWLRVDEALTEDYLALGRQLALPVDGIEQAAAMQLVRNWLSSSDKRWLLLCDNADQITPAELRRWLPTNPQGRILITSRSPQWAKMGSVLRLEVFTEQEAAAFWQQRVMMGQDWPSARMNARQTPIASFSALAAELGHLPLAWNMPPPMRKHMGWMPPPTCNYTAGRRRDLWDNTRARGLPRDHHHHLGNQL
ncbi:MAG: NB-ARC domain-containing protein [Chloroflexota bacterium]